MSKELLQEEKTKNNGNTLYEHFRFVADKGQNLLRVDKFLTNRINGTSRNRIQQAAEAGYVLSNGNPIKSSYKVKPLDVITIAMDHPCRELVIIPENIPLNIVYEDPDLIVIDKPAGMVVHPGFGNYSRTLVNAIAWHLQDDEKQSTQNSIDNPQLGLVHRIDKDTSGLLVVAKNSDAKTYLCMQFYQKTTLRHYIALVWGNVKNDEGQIEGNVGRDINERMLMTVFPKGDYGKPAITHYRVLERFGYVTLIECCLETGRTHQIRVHMKYIGHTLFNDERYGGNEILKGTNHAKYQQFVRNCFNICPRQALHARTLGFSHPRTKEKMFFKSQIPDDMSQLIDKWRNFVLTV